MTRESPFCKRDEIADSPTHLSRAFLARASFWRFSVTAISPASHSLATDCWPLATVLTPLATRHSPPRPLATVLTPRPTEGQYATKSYVFPDFFKFPKNWFRRKILAQKGFRLFVPRRAFAVV